MGDAPRGNSDWYPQSGQRIRSGTGEAIFVGDGKVRHAPYDYGDADNEEFDEEDQGEFGDISDDEDQNDEDKDNAGE